MPEVSYPASSSPGAYDIIRFKDNQTGIPDFNITLANNPGVNGATVYDNVISFGYNFASTGRQVAGKHVWGFSFESDYTTSEDIRQAEYYITYSSEAGNTIRPFGITPHLDTDYIDINFLADRLRIGSTDSNNDWIDIYSANGDDGGTLQIQGADSTILFLDDVVDLMRWGGNAIVSAASGIAKFAYGFTTASLFGVANTNNSDLALNFGGTNPRSHRWNHTNKRFEIQTEASKWEPIATHGMTTTNTLNGTSNNWIPENFLSRWLRIPASVDSIITGILSDIVQYDGQEHILVNVSTKRVTLKHQNTGSDAANRIICASGRDEVLLPNQTALIGYDATSSRWRLIRWPQGGPEVLNS